MARSGGSAGGPVTVDYATSDGTASAGSDYAGASGTLTFGPGEVGKSFTVPVTSDSAQEGDDTFQVTISNAGGGANIGSPAGATVTIINDDASPVEPPGSDGTAPKLTLAAKRVQRALKTKLLAVSARFNERCKLAAVARVRIGVKRVILGRAKRIAPSGIAVKMKLRLSKTAVVKLRRAMKGGKAKVVFSVRAADAAGNTAFASRRVLAKR